MGVVNQVKSAAAKVSGQQGGLINQRTGGKSHDQQLQIVKFVTASPGYTATQSAWVMTGGQLDRHGNCVPADLFARVNEFFNLKRRASEIAFDAKTVSDHPNARLVYGKALCNPYTKSGGHGLYPLRGRGEASHVVEPVSKRVVNQPEEPVEVEAMVDCLSDMLRD